MSEPGPVSRVLADVVADWVRVTRAAGAVAAARIASAFAVSMVPADSWITVAGAAGGGHAQLAAAAGRGELPGIDLVHRCVNDLLAAGAEPFLFDGAVRHHAAGLAELEAAITGIGKGCHGNGVALLGCRCVSDADLPAGAFGVAGTLIGWATPAARAAMTGPQPGDLAVGLHAAGLHSHGHGAALAVLADAGVDRRGLLAGTDETVERALLAPHKSYFGVLRDPVLGGWLHALVPVVDAGLLPCLERALEPGRGLQVDRGAWPLPPLFALLVRHAGGFDAAAREWNLGIGMVGFVPPERAEAFLGLLRAWNEPHWLVGTVAGSGGLGLVGTPRT